MTAFAEGVVCEPGGGQSFSVGPSTVSVKVERLATGDGFALIEWTIPPGAPAPPQHVHHRGSETFFVLEGELEFPLADRVVRAVAGTCLHVPPGTVHTLANPRNVPARALELFCPGTLMGLIEDVGRVFASGLPPDRDQLLAAFARYDSALVAVAV